MQARLFKRVGATALAAGLALSVAGAASAHPSKANTKMRFHLEDHQVAVGDTVTGPVHLSTRDGHHWVPLAGVELTVKVDGTDTGSPVTTDSNGDATVSYVTTSEGDHVIKVVYAGDDTHRKRQRAQGFEVTAATT